MPEKVRWSSDLNAEGKEGIPRKIWPGMRGALEPKLLVGGVSQLTGICPWCPGTGVALLWAPRSQRDGCWGCQ